LGADIVSIRIVHIVFIVAATITAFGFGAWAVFEYRASGNFGDLALAIGSVVAGIALVWYGKKFFKKLKTLKSVRVS